MICVEKDAEAESRLKVAKDTIGIFGIGQGCSYGSTLLQSCSLCFLC